MKTGGPATSLGPPPACGGEGGRPKFFIWAGRVGGATTEAVLGVPESELRSSRPPRPPLPDDATHRRRSADPPHKRERDSISSLLKSQPVPVARMSVAICGTVPDVASGHALARPLAHPGYGLPLFMCDRPAACGERRRRHVSLVSPVLAKKILPIRRQADQDIAASAVLAHRKSAVDRVLPHREPWARGSPGLDHVGMGSRLARDPFQQIENQGIEIVVRHDVLQVFVR